MHNDNNKEFRNYIYVYVYGRATNKRGHINVLNSEKKNTYILKNSSDDTMKFK